MPTRPTYRRAPAPPRPTDTRPRLPGAPGPKPAVISRADTIVELRTIYRLIDQQLYAAAKSKLVLLGRNLQH